MALILDTYETMKAVFDTLPDGDARDYSLSCLEVMDWCLESEDSGDIKIGLWKEHGISAFIEVKGEGRDRVYRVMVVDEIGNMYWDVADQIIRRAEGKAQDGKDRDQLNEDSKIVGTLFDALIEGEKVRDALNARLNQP